MIQTIVLCFCCMSFGAMVGFAVCAILTVAAEADRADEKQKKEIDKNAET